MTPKKRFSKRQGVFSLLTTIMWATAMLSAMALPGVFASNLANPSAPVLRGRVVDEEGQPLDGVDVVAMLASVMSERDPWDPLGPKFVGRTDANGRYAIPVLVSNTEYVVFFHKPGFRQDYADLKPNHEPECVTTLERVPLHRLEGQVVDQESARPVAGATVTLTTRDKVFFLGEMRVLTAETQTDEEGGYVFENVSEYLRCGTVHAEKDGYFTEIISTHYEDGAPKPLVMAKGGWIEGTVRAKTSGEPLAGCMVRILHPGAMLQEYVSQRVVRTDENGFYRIDRLPRGTYPLAASHPKWIMPPYGPASYLIARVGAGRPEICNVEMRKKAIIRGRVLGSDNKPVPGVLVRSSRFPDYDDFTLSKARTDEKGRFEIRTGRVKPERDGHVTMSVYDDRLGRGHAAISDLEEGEIREGIRHGAVIRLGGMMRVFGRVTDPEGNPIPNVDAWGVATGGHGVRHDSPITDRAGRYDLGWRDLSVKPGETTPITFYAPRPDDGDLPQLPRLVNGSEPAPPPAPDARFFYHQVESVLTKDGKELELNVVLEPTELLTFSGRVVDSEGSPLPRSALILFAGNAWSPLWEYEFWPEAKYGTSSAPDQPFSWGTAYRTIADDDGRYTLYWVREEAETATLGLSVHFEGSIDPAIYSIGVMTKDYRKKLIQDIRMPIGRTEIQVDIQMPAPEDEGKDAELEN